MAQEKINVVYDFVDKSGSGISSAIGGLTSLGGAAAKFAVAGLATVGAAMGAAGIAAIKLGSDAEEMQGKFDVVFATMGAEVTANLDAFAAVVGRSKFELRGFAAQLGDTFKPMGFTEQAAADMATQVTKLAVDLGSFNNMETGEALARLQGGLIGNHENLLTFGVRINEAILKEELLRMGMDKLTGAALEQAKAQARLNLIVAGTSDANSDAERTAGSFANQMRRLTSTVFDAGTEIGLTLLPMVTPLLTKFGELAKIGATRLVPVFEGMSAAFLRFFDLNSKGMPIVANVKTLIDALGDAVGLSPEVTARLAHFGTVAAQMFVDMSEGVPKVQAIATAFDAVATPAQKEKVLGFSEAALDMIATTQGLGDQTGTIFAVVTERLGGLANQAITLGGILARNFRQNKKEFEDMATAVAGISASFTEEVTPAIETASETVTPILSKWARVAHAVSDELFGVGETMSGTTTPAIEGHNEKLSLGVRLYNQMVEETKAIIENGTKLTVFLDGALTSSLEWIIEQFNVWQGVLDLINTTIDLVILKLGGFSSSFGEAVNNSGALSFGNQGEGALPTPSAGGVIGGGSTPGAQQKPGHNGKPSGTTNIMNVITNAASLNVQNSFKLMDAQAGGI